MKGMGNVISVIVPIYKVETFIRQCIRSLVNQTFKDFEIILVDDGSPDKCPEICDEYALKDMRIKVIHKPNGGLVSARKAGVAHSCGEYITFVDGDDWIADDYIEQINNIIQQCKPDVVAVTDFYSVKGEKKQRMRMGRQYMGIYTVEKLAKDFYPYVFTYASRFDFGTTPSVWSKVIRRDLIEKYLPKTPENIRMGEDFAVSLPCMLDASNIYFTDLCGYYYRQNPASMTHTFDADAPIRIASLLEDLRQKTSKNACRIDDQLALYAVFMTDFTLKSLLMTNACIGPHLTSFRVLWNDISVKDGLKRALPAKTKLLLRMARFKQVWFLYGVRYLKYHKAIRNDMEM